MKSVIRNIRSLALAASLAAPMVFSAAPVAHADDEGFWINNTSSHVISAVYVVHADIPGDWLPVAGIDALQPGQNAGINFARTDPSACAYDLRIETASGAALEFLDVDLCTNDVVTVTG